MGILELAPSEYWNMTPREVSLYIEARRPKARFGNIGERDADEMSESRDRLESMGVNLL